MPKVKTHSASKKRFKRNKNGNIKYSQGYRRHLLTKKTAKRKRQLRKGSFIAKVDAPRIRKLLPSSN